MADQAPGVEQQQQQQQQQAVDLTAVNATLRMQLDESRSREVEFREEVKGTVQVHKKLREVEARLAKTDKALAAEQHDREKHQKTADWLQSKLLVAEEDLVTTLQQRDELDKLHAIELGKLKAQLASGEQQRTAAVADLEHTARDATDASTNRIAELDGVIASLRSENAALSSRIVNQSEELSEATRTVGELKVLVTEGVACNPTELREHIVAQKSRIRDLELVIIEQHERLTELAAAAQQQQLQQSPVPAPCDSLAASVSVGGLHQLDLSATSSAGLGGGSGGGATTPTPLTRVNSSGGPAMVMSARNRFRDAARQLQQSSKDVHAHRSSISHHQANNSEELLMLKSEGANSQRIISEMARRIALLETEARQRRT